MMTRKSLQMCEFDFIMKTDEKAASFTLSLFFKHLARTQHALSNEHQQSSTPSFALVWNLITDQPSNNFTIETKGLH